MVSDEMIKWKRLTLRINGGGRGGSLHNSWEPYIGILYLRFCTQQSWTWVYL